MAKNLIYSRKPLWEIWDNAVRKKAFDFSEGYKDWLGKSKTERMAVKSTEVVAKKEGFISLDKVLQGKEGSIQKESRLVNPGDKIYDINRAQNIVLAVLGRKPITEGIKIILSHTDSPRLDLKVLPLYEKEKVAFFKTNYYGGIKKYHWPAVPLALHGVIVEENGNVIEISIGESSNDPIFMITDLLPHLDAGRSEKVLKDAFKGEELNIVAGSIPEKEEGKGSEPNTSSKSGKSDNDLIKKGILRLLNDKYGIKEEDFISADLTAVPAGMPRDLGVDRSMVAGYGQDDKICAYTSLKALLDLKRIPEYTSIVAFTDREEIGSEGNTSATSLYFYDFIGRLMSLQMGSGDALESDTKLRTALARSKAISADVTAAIDPDYPHVYDMLTNPRIGQGVVLEKYTGHKGKSLTSEASAEYVSELRSIFNKAEVCWQGGGGIGKVDVGGGGTIAMFLARYNMDICDVGPPIWNMHAPWEIASKADVYSAYSAYLAFFNSK